MVQVPVSNGSVSFEVKDFTQGIKLEKINSDAVITIDYETDLNGSTNVTIPMTIQQYANTLQAIDNRHFIHQLESVLNGGTMEIEETYENLPVLFSMNGELPLDEDKRYKVSITNIRDGFATIDYSRIRNYYQGSPLRIHLKQIDSELSQKQLNVVDFQCLIFPSATQTNDPNVFPTKIAYNGQGGKVVEIDKSQLDLLAQGRRLSTVVSSDRDNPTGQVRFIDTDNFVFFPIVKLPKVTIYKPAGSILQFYAVEF